MLPIQPEFLNRVDEIVVFDSLGKESIETIVRLQFEDIKRRVLEKNIDLEFDKKVVEFIDKRGYDPVYGARPLKRVLQLEILNPLSQKIISEDIKKLKKVKVSANDMHVVLSDY